ncbi:hypothetical protein ERO13_A07G160875v2, partial [Gossypium hirsutum]
KTECSPLFPDPSELWKTTDLHHLVFLRLAAEIDKLQSSFHQWERILPDTEEQVHLMKELLANCESIEWQRSFSVGIDNRELESRRRWTITARTQAGDVKKYVVARKENGNSASAIRHELMKLPISHQSDRSYQYSAEDNDDFIASESDRQMLLINLSQNEELDELSASFERIGGFGLTIHEELLAQEKIIDDLGTEMDCTTNRLDFVQKKVAMVMKKASAKGHIMMILILLVLFIILFILVFLT